MSSQLSQADQARVDEVLARGVNAVERKPFRPWLLLGVIVLLLTSLSGLSYFIALSQGVV